MMSAIRNNNTLQMDAAMPAVATTSHTAFAQQLDDIDKALFEYRYRKQNQQYHSAGSNNNKYGHHHQPQHYQKPHKNNRHKSSTATITTANNNKKNHFNKHQQPLGNIGSIGNNGSSNRVNYQSPISLLPQVSPPLHYQPEPLPAIGHHDPFNIMMMSRSAMLAKSPINGPGPGLQGLIASSPDSFLISNDDHHLMGSRLSSSVISSSGTTTSSTTSSYSPVDYDANNNHHHLHHHHHQNNPAVAANLTGSLSLSGAGSGVSQFNNAHHGGFGAATPAFDEFNGSAAAFNNAGGNVNGKSDKSLGWLNIWGSDMSVWG